jgi:hypothetical protein
MSRREPAAVVDAAANKPNVESAPQQAVTLDQQGDGARLLHDIIAGFRQTNGDRLRTAVLIEDLSASGDRRRSGESGRDAQRLARRLHPLHRPKTIRFVVGTAKGYLRRCFEGALKHHSDRLAGNSGGQP